MHILFSFCLHINVIYRQPLFSWNSLTFTDSTALSFRYVVAFAVEDATLCRKTHGDSALTAAEATGVHPEHVAIVVVHSVKSAGRFCLCKTQSSIHSALVLVAFMIDSTNKTKRVLTTGLSRIDSYGVRRDLNVVHLCPRELLAAEFQSAVELMLTGHHGNPYVWSPPSACALRCQ